MSFANINNIKICYEIHGDGYPLILIHGFGSKKESWVAQTNPLSNYFKVIVFDNRGAGKSDRPDDAPYTMDMYTDDIRGLMDFLKIEKAHVCGWSLGGMIVQSFVLKYPEQVNKVVLINSSYKTVSNVGNSDFKEMFVKMRLEDLELAKHDPENSFWKSTRVSYYHKFRKQMKANPKKKFYNLWSVEDVINQRTIDPQTPRDVKNQAGILIGFNTFDRLEEIKNKTLLLTASHDRILSKSMTIEMHGKIPNSELKTIEKAGHASPRSRAPEVNQIIINFLKN